MLRRVQPLLRGLERAVWGGDRRGDLLAWLLARHQWSRYRRQWVFVPREQQPHFFDHRLGAALLAAGEGNPYGWFRGFYVAELLRPGDRVLDIGCGDGFFDRRFYSERCERVDAVDIEPSAIAHARRHNAAANVSYRLLDAVREEFPEPPYDIVVWEGALGHFAAADTQAMLEKISASLTPGGVFVGSESLGHEGHDHLQFFDSLGDLRSLFEGHFPHVRLRRIEYAATGSDFVRNEAYWRCAADPARLDDADWQRGD